MTDDLVNRLVEEGAAPKVREPHWTDNATSRPIFKSVIDATGPRANMISIGSAASAMLHQLRVPRDRIEELTNGITMAESYEDAIALVEHWFTVRRDET